MTRIREWSVFALIWGAYVLLADRFWFVTEDAFISFRYAQNWALGHGPRYNLGDQLPVEGYSNFLWVAVCPVVEWLGGSVAWWLGPFSSFQLLKRTLMRHGLRLVHNR